MSGHKTVFLVEDDPVLSDAFEMTLISAGYAVAKAFDGAEALEKLKDINPDIILLDMLMPNVDGLEFLKEFENTRQIPVVVFSNLDSKNSIDQAISLGATRYVLKSWATPRDVLTIVKDELAGS